MSPISEPVMTTRPSTQETRERLLAAALEAFGQRDYDAVSTRELATAAGVNLAAISYHFGGKHGLYLATARLLGERMRALLHEDLSWIRSTYADASPEECRRLVGDLIGRLASRLLGDEFGRHVPGLIIREQGRPTEAFEILYETLFGPVHHVLGELIGRARNRPADDDEIRVIAHALIGQAVIFRAGRTALLRYMDREGFDECDLVHIRRVVAALAESALATPGEGVQR